jgi:hypothetical protein
MLYELDCCHCRKEPAATGTSGWWGVTRRCRRASPRRHIYQSTISINQDATLSLLDAVRVALPSHALTRASSERCRAAAPRGAAVTACHARIASGTAAGAAAGLPSCRREARTQQAHCRGAPWRRSRTRLALGLGRQAGVARGRRVGPARRGTPSHCHTVPQEPPRRRHSLGHSLGHTPRSPRPAPPRPDSPRPASHCSLRRAGPRVRCCNPVALSG